MRALPLLLGSAVTASCASGSSTTPHTPAAADPRAVHEFLAERWGGHVLDCPMTLPPGTEVETDLPGPTSVSDGHLLRVVPTASGRAVLRRPDHPPALLVWDLALDGVDCDVAPLPLRELRGRVRDTGRSPAAGVRVHGCGIDTVTGADGSFSGRVQPAPGAFWGAERLYCVLAADVGTEGTMRVLPLVGAEPEVITLQPGEPIDEVDTPWVPPLGDVPPTLAPDLEPPPTRPDPPVLVRRELVGEGRGLTPPVFRRSTLVRALQPGHSRKLTLATPTGTTRRTWEVVASTPDGLDTMARDGGLDTTPKPYTWPWNELQGSSQLPAQAATVRAEERAVFGVSSRVWIVEGELVGTSMRRRSLYAESLPGLPIEMRTWADGKLVETLTVVSASP